MEATLILWPVLAQISLAILLYLKLAAVKARELKAGNADLRETALNQEAWPESVRKINNNLRNQFETPVLFYVLCLILWGMAAVDMAAMIIACVYVGSRFCHSYIHTGSNNVKRRMPMFVFGFTALVALLVLTIRALASA